MTATSTAIGRLRADETGATAIEYALLAGFIAMVVIAAIAGLGRTLDGFYGDTNSRLTAEINASSGEEPK